MNGSRLVLVALLCAAACSPFDSSAAPAPTPDAGTTSPPIDADGGAPSDAGDADGGNVTLLDAGSTPCTTTFCDGFEGREFSAASPSPWDQFIAATGDQAAIDTVHMHGGASAFHLTVGASSVTGEHHSFLKKTFTRTDEASFEIAYWYYAAPYRQSNQMTIELNGTSLEQEVSLVPNTTQLLLGAQTYGSGSDYIALVKTSVPAMAQWNHVVVHIDLTSSTPPITLTFNEAQLVSSAPLRDAEGIDKIDVTLGPDYTDTGGAYEIWFDDVTVNLK